jgi:putative holliday junction resolvase
MRILALDVGKKRIGIAISDPLRIIAKPHSTIERSKKSYDRIAQLTKELEVNLILIGLPLHLDGTEGEQTADVRKFAEKLAQVVGPIQIKFKDERLSSIEAEQRLADRYGDWRKRKSKIDSFAAASFLEDYLKEQ